MLVFYKHIIVIIIILLFVELITVIYAKFIGTHTLTLSKL